MHEDAVTFALSGRKARRMSRLIDVDALIALVQDSTILGNGFKQAFCALVNGEPTIEPERKTGKWNMYYRMHSGDTFVCNRCGSCFVVLQGEDKMNHCPNCGSRMER